MNGILIFVHGNRSYDNPFQQTDNHMELYQKLCARVNSEFDDFRVRKLEFKNSHYVHNPAPFACPYIYYIQLAE